MGRSTQGVTIIKTAEDEKVISATRIQDVEGDDAEDTEDVGEDENPDSGVENSSEEN